LIGALAIGIHLSGSSSSAADDAHTTTTSNAAISMNHDDPSAAIPPPPATPDVPSVSIDDLKEDGRGKASVSTDDGDTARAAHAWAPPAHHSHASHHADSAAAAPATFVSTKRTTAKQPQGFGLVRTWIAARGETISVDGRAVGTAPAPVKVACGPHTIAIGSEIVKANVPCDGTVTVGSPDHKR
jgi:hypothetical protein